MAEQHSLPWRVVFYKGNRGRSPIAEYLDALSVSEQAASYEAFRLLREYGTLLGMPHAKHIEGKLWEL